MKGSGWLFGLLAGVATGLLHFAAFPPWDVAEAAYVFAVPLLLWVFAGPSRKRLIVCPLVGFWLSWVLIIVWLRYVYPPMGSVGLVLLTFLLSLFPASWAWLASWLLRPALDRGFGVRMLALLGLAGYWLILEWLRTWVLTGFPWLPLAASQWLRPAMLQTAEYGGQYAVSFILIFFNLALAVYFHRLFMQPFLEPAEVEAVKSDDPDGPTTTFRSTVKLRWRFCPEFYMALALVFLSVWLYVRTLAQAQPREPMLNVAAVQPWIPPDLKWTQEGAEQSLHTLARQTREVAAATPKPDLILWPEAALPSPVITKDSNPWMQNWIMQGVQKIDTPLLTGGLGHFSDDTWVNAIFLFDPEDGLYEGYYAKRRLVPFGEYIPLRDMLFFIDTVVPLEIDLKPGEHSRPFPINANGRIWQAGALICYEDIFSSLGREVALEGADFIVVVTNDGWYGEEAGAYQHAAHSVLRAVETRRPVVRCGNHGWSGWIDEYGNVRDVLIGPDGTVYARQSKTFALSQDPAWAGRQTFYVRVGPWTLWLGAAFLVVSVGRRWRERRVK